MAGRPSSYNETTANAICDRIAEGEYLTDICNEDGFPSYKTVRKWIAEREQFSKAIARAGEDQMEYFRWRISKLNDTMKANNWQYVNAQIRNIQWLMGKIRPKAYGDKVEQFISGPEGRPIQSAITVEFVKSPAKHN